MLFKLSNLNSNLALTLGYLNPALNNSALYNIYEYLVSKLSLEVDLQRILQSCTCGSNTTYRLGITLMNN